MSKSLRYYFQCVVLGTACIAQAAPIDERSANSPTQYAEQANKKTVGILAEGINGTATHIAADMATVMDSDDSRILAIIGKGSIQNIDDLLHLKGIDMAIVQLDVLEHLKRTSAYKDIDKRINYITKLYNEEFHLLAGPEITQLNQLANRKVNFDVKSSGTAITAALLFETLKVSVEPTYFDQTTALEKLKIGEIAALAYVTGKPASLFEKIPVTDKLHFLAVDHTPNLLETYLPSSLNNKDYPSLIQDKQDIKTIAVSSILAVYSWKSYYNRYQKIANFTINFFNHFNAFQPVGRHLKWQEVNFSANVPGWTRFPPAQEWLQHH